MSAAEKKASSNPEEEQLVCHCRQVSWKRIRLAMDSGIRDLPQIMIRTQAGSGCGSCRDLIRQELANLKPK